MLNESENMSKSVAVSIEVYVDIFSINAMKYKYIIHKKVTKNRKANTLCINKYLFNKPF